MKTKLQKVMQLSILLIIIFLSISCKKELSRSVPVPATVTDIDGNVYHIIIIGSQVWLKENLKTSHFRNGVIIPHITDSNLWSTNTSAAWCNYRNLSINDSIYGKLYNWYAVHDTRNIAPKGWHIADPMEWGALFDFLGGRSIAGGKLKEIGTTHWTSPNTGATSEVNFTALSGGGVFYSFFEDMEKDAYWWSTWTYIFSQDRGYAASINYIGTNCQVGIYYEKCSGLSVRCVMDAQ
ncbi:MAG: fibrobacter succinogenes major paralogous domain-containing protein [Bacteroidales bacterium]